MTNPMTGQPKPQINNWLWQSIVATVCCCNCISMILGIIGIVFAAQVNGKLAAGDVVGAEESAKKAKLFTLIALGVGVLIWILAGLFYGGIFIAAMSGQH